MEETQSPKSKKTTANISTSTVTTCTGQLIGHDNMASGMTYLAPTVSWDGLKAMALPVKKAVFHRTVVSWKGEPETALFSQVKGTHKASRVAKMWCTSSVLMVEQDDNFRSIIPLANVSQIILE